MLKKVILLSVLCACFSSYASNTSSNRANWLEDLDYLLTNAPKEHVDFYKKHSEDAFTAAANTLKNDIPHLQDHEVIVRLASLLSMAKDGHSFIRFYHPLFESEFGDGMHFKPVPLRFAAFDDGVYVVATHKNFKKYHGAQLISVNGVLPSKALQTISTMFPIENEMNINQWGVYGLSAPEILHAFNLSDSTSFANYSLLKNGTTHKVSLESLDTWPKEQRGIVVDPNWISLSQPQPQPLYLQNLNRMAWHTYHAANNLVYLKINGFSKAELESIEQEVAAAIAVSNSKENSKLVLDIRHHPGGETGVVNGLVKAIAASTANQKKRLYVIIGGRTFSAAQLMATALEQYTYAKFVGEPTGINIHFFANARNRFDLPNSGLKIFVSTNLWQTTNANDDRKWQAPDIETPLNFSDYLLGKDPALEAIIGFK